MWIPEDDPEVQIECRDCGEPFLTDDPLRIICSSCIDANVRHDARSLAYDHAERAFCQG
jgi:hypothetical protein